MALSFILVIVIYSCQQKQKSNTNNDDKLTVLVKNIRKTTIKFMYSDGSVAYLRGWKNYAYFLLSRKNSIMNDSTFKFKPMKYAQSIHSSRLWVITRDSSNNMAVEEIDLSNPDTCKCGIYQCASSLANYDCFTDGQNISDRYPCPVAYLDCPDCKKSGDECLIPPPADFCSFMQSNCSKWFPVSGEIKDLTIKTPFLCEAFK